MGINHFFVLTIHLIWVIYKIEIYRWTMLRWGILPLVNLVIRQDKCKGWTMVILWLYIDFTTEKIRELLAYVETQTVAIRIHVFSAIVLWHEERRK